MKLPPPLLQQAKIALAALFGISFMASCIALSSGSDMYKILGVVSYLLFAAMALTAYGEYLAK